VLLEKAQRRARDWCSSSPEQEGTIRRIMLFRTTIKHRNMLFKKDYALLNNN
jgi:hypothetical protein